MIFLRVYILIVVCLYGTTAKSQDVNYRYSKGFDDEVRGDNRFRVAFYNVENLFDLTDDSLTKDDEFTPEGSNHYSFGRYKKKSDGIARTLLAMGGWEPVELIGLCEVESDWVLNGLTTFSPLKKANYQIIHEDSPDFRGIDVAALYRPDKFNLLFYEYIRIRFPFDPDRKTRDILYIKGILPNKDTLNFFVNHWPSRYGGQFASEPGRAYVAEILKNKVDSLYDLNPEALILITGDFNDEPDDISLKDILQAKLRKEETPEKGLFNLMYSIKYKFGTHSFAGEWGVLDQFIASYPLISDSGSTRIANESGLIFDAPWLLKSNAAGHSVTNRTFQGPAYKGGYSDHLPIFIDLSLSQKESPDNKVGASQ